MLFLNDRIIILVFLAFLVLLVSFAFWRKAAIFLMYWIILVGAIRKWVFPQQSDVMFFSIHVILTGIYVRFLFSQYRLKSVPQLLLFFLVMLILWGAFSLFNLRLPDMRIGILGFIIHFYYLPFMFVIQRLFRTRTELISFLEKYTMFSLPLLLLGIVQYFSPVDSEINRYVNEAMVVATIGERARITATFSYISGYTAYLTVNFIVLIYLLSSEKVKMLYKGFFGVLMVLTTINLFMTGSRGPIGICMISAVLYMTIISRLGVRLLGKVFAKLLILAGLILFVFNTSYGAKESYDVFKERTKSSEDIIPRLVDNFTPFKYLKEAGFLGFGIGTTYQGAERFDVSWGNMPRDFEEEAERILLELGLAGYVLVYSLRFILLFLFWKLFKGLRQVDLKLLALCSLLFQLQFFHFGSLVFNLTSGIFYWFFVGFLFLLPKLDKRRLRLIPNESLSLSSR